MPRFIAFLRAINVGGHVVKMDHLRQLFESLGFANVETFIASGNVVFETTSQNTRILEAKIAERLRKALGYKVATFVRTDAELVEIAKYAPFPRSKLNSAAAFNLAFLSHVPAAASKRKLLAWRTEIDDFHVHKREVYWLCRKKQSESKFSNAVLEKTLGQVSTLRGVKTVKAMAEKYSKASNK